MVKRHTRNWIATLAIVALALVAGVGAGALWENKFTFLGDAVQTSTVTSTSEIITAVERREEIVLLSTATQGLYTVEKEARLFKWDVPGSRRTNILQYRFTAKLGIDGQQVKIKETAPGAYHVQVPAFKIIGLDDPQFQTVHQDGKILSFATEGIDTAEAVNQVLNDDTRKEHIDLNRGLLEEQTRIFYNGIVHAIDDSATLEFEFTDSPSL